MNKTKIFIGVLTWIILGFVVGVLCISFGFLLGLATMAIPWYGFVFATICGMIIVGGYILTMDGGSKI